MKKLTMRPSLKELQETHQKISPFIHRTPVLTSQSINKISHANLFFKCENFQKIGAFKMRGAISTALRLSDEERANGLATHSSGNHAQAVAKSAQLLNIPSYIVMPKTAPTIKREATAGYGAKIIDSEATTASREATLEKVVAETGASFIHPYNDYNVIAGQATAAKELLEDVRDLDIIMAPVGGGGLISGTCLITHYTHPKTQVIGAEPNEVNDAYLSLQAGHIVENKTINTIADGLRTTIREKTFHIIQDHIHSIITVSEESIVKAMRIIWERMKIIIEPSCAVPFAAVLTSPETFEGKRVGIILTGGNVDLNKLPF